MKIARIGMFLSIILILGVSRPVEAFRIMIEPKISELRIGESAVLSLFVDTQGENVNVLDLRLAYLVDQLTVLSYRTVGSVFPRWPLPPDEDIAPGQIRFVGAIQSPGYTGSKGKIGEIVVKPRRVGVVSLETIADSGAYLNDGFGTRRSVYEQAAAGIQVLPTRRGHTQTRSTQTATPTPAPASSATPQALIPGDLAVTSGVPEVYSSTHPDPLRWYANADPVFVWFSLPGEDYSVRLDRDPMALPDDVIDPVTTSTQYHALADGVWFFHLKARTAQGWTETSHVRIQIDTMPPEPFQITLLQPDLAFQHQYALGFWTKDETSGIDHWQVHEPTRTFKTRGAPYILHAQDPGWYTVQVTAIDQAGNSRTSTFTVRIPLPYWIPWSYWLSILVIALLLSLFMLIIHRTHIL